MKSLVDALQLAIVKFVYEDIGEICLYPTSDDIYENERNFALILMKLLVANSDKTNLELISIFMQRLAARDIPARLKNNLIAVLDNALAFQEHSLLTIGRKNKEVTQEDYLRIGDKPCGSADGYMAVKRISSSDPAQDSKKYLYRWLLKIDAIKEFSRAEYIRKHYQRNFAGEQAGKERALEKGRIITSKIFPRFIMLKDFFNARTHLLSTQSGWTRCIWHDLKLDPIYKSPQQTLYIYGKPIVGLVHALALAYIYQSLDIHNLSNIGFTDHEHYIKFELIDFGVYDISEQKSKQRKDQLNTLLLKGDYAQILNLLLPKDCEQNHILKEMISQAMIANELPCVLDTSKNMEMPVLNNFPLEDSIWNWRSVLKNDEVTQAWCMKTLDSLKFFPTQCINFICALRNKPPLLSHQLDAIIAKPTSTWCELVNTMNDKSNCSLQ